MIPRKISAVHDHAADGRSVSAYPLRGALHNDMGTMLDRPEEISCRTERVVNHEGHAYFIRKGGESFEIGDVVPRVNYRLYENGLCMFVDELLELMQYVVIVCMIYYAM